MKRIGEDVAEKLNYQPSVFTVERRLVISFKNDALFLNGGDRR